MAAIQREKARRSLEEFIYQGWSVLEPVAPFVRGWHISAICEHLEAITNGEITRLVINVPPSTMKSLTASVFWPAWEWGPKDLTSLRYLSTTYAERYVTRDSRRTRDLMLSDWYQQNWGDRVQLIRTGETSFANSKTGYREGVPFRSLTAGRGDRLIIDDPHSTETAESDAERARVIRIFLESATTRLNDPKRSAIVVIMQRLHTHDLTGVILEKELGYVHLMLPMEFEPERCCSTSIGFKDPRKKDGELLWPERMPRDVVDRDKTTLGSYGTACQFQQSPGPREGGLVKLDWFGRYGEPPGPRKIRRIIQSWDTADKGGQKNAYSVCETWAETKSGYYLLHVLRQRMNIPELERTVVSHAKLWKPAAVLIEEAASGVAIIQHMRAKTRFPVIGIRPDKDKITRMDIETPTLEAGNCFLPEEADWLADFEAECRNFPNTQFKDQVDSMSQFLYWVRIHGEPDDWEIY